jgi:hypothetical protein
MNTQGPARPLLPLRHARGRRRRSGLGGAAVQRVERARCAKGLCCTCPSGEGHRSACSGVGSTIVGSGARARAAWGRGHGTHGRPYARVSCVRPSSVLRARFDFPYKAIIAAVFPQRVPTELEHRLNSQVLSDFSVSIAVTLPQTSQDDAEMSCIAFEGYTTYIMGNQRPMYII